MKKGFTLAETVVALSVIVIMTFCFFTMASYSNGSFQRSVVKNASAVHLENVKNIFETTNFVENNAFSATEFETSLRFCGYDLVQTEENLFEVSCKIGSDGAPNQNAIGEVKFSLENAWPKVKLSANVFLGEKLIYQMPSFERLVA